MSSAPKAPHSKSRNGCMRCRAKKTKCDEQKPSCARCLDRGFECPGYALNVRWSQRHQSQLDNKSPASSPSSPSPPSSSSSSSVRPPRRAQRSSPRLASGSNAQSPAVSRQSNDDELHQLEHWLSSRQQLETTISDHVFLYDDVACPPQSDAASCPTPSWDLAAIVVGDVSSEDSADSLGTIGDLVAIDVDSSSLDELALIGPVRDELDSSLHSDTDLIGALISPRLGPPRELSDQASLLSGYFFKEVIALYCAWDSESNTMRVLVESMWQSCGALHHTIQSMAAACLARDFPYLAAVAYREHVQAIDYVKSRSSDTPCDEATLLACMLLGHTASWLNPQNLATDMFRESCELLKDMAARRYSEDSHSFFSNTVDYWAMLLAFLTGRDELGDYQTHATARPPRPPGALDPHPYSGISRETVQLLTEIGLVIFAYRKHMANITFMAESDVEVFKSALRQARYLEMRLTEHRTLDLSQVKELGDRRTTLDHLQLIDEAYRCTGLLQLYRVFPDLLRLRYAPWSKENLLLPGPAVKTPTAEERQEWLTKLAVHTLDILRDIPFESHTRSVQPFIMVALSGELKYTDLGPDGTPVACPASIEVMTARKFIYSRLVAYSHIFPIRKTQVILELITHIWSQADAGHDVYWADVAHGRNLGTMMG